MSFRDELFRPGGKNLAWKFVLKKEAKKFVLFFKDEIWGQIFWGQKFEDEIDNQDEINVFMTWLHLQLQVVKHKQQTVSGLACL